MHDGLACKDDWDLTRVYCKGVESERAEAAPPALAGFGGKTVRSKRSK